MRISTQAARPAQRLAARHAQRLAHHLQSEVAGGLAHRLSSIPARRVDEIMATPARRVMLDTIFWALPHVLSRSDAHRLTSSIRFQVPGHPDDPPDLYWVAFRDGRWHSGRGGGQSAQLTITVGGPGLVALACGRMSPTREYLAGRLRVRGNPLLASKLLTLIRGELAPVGAEPLEPDMLEELEALEPPGRRRFGSRRSP